MPIESSHDPRECLVRRKYFSLRPQPLEQWLWRQGIAPSAERVFWLHWQEGMRNRNWCSSIPLRRVAALCSLDVSSVTRAYQLLGRLGLVRRQDPGRDPSRPFEQAVAITEVRVPRALLQELGQYPDRTASATPAPAQASPSAPPITNGSDAAPQLPDALKGLSGRERRRALGDLLSQLSANERRGYDEALRARQPHLVFDADSKVGGEGRAALLQILQISASTPQHLAMHAVASSSAANACGAPRQVGQLELARLRRELVTSAGLQRSSELFREVVWAVEQGALKRFHPLHGIRIALKKIREQAWTRPNRMPPNWARDLAQAGQCRSA
jgi:hypothetical protein